VGTHDWDMNLDFHLQAERMVRSGLIELTKGTNKLEAVRQHHRDRNELKWTLIFKKCTTLEELL
jgi:hypothetical protein